MKLDNLPLATWQHLLDEYKRSRKPVLAPPPCFRADGTQFSVGILYGGFTFNGAAYTTIPAVEEGAFLACSPAFLAWAAKRKSAFVDADKQRKEEEAMKAAVWFDCAKCGGRFHVPNGYQNATARQFVILGGRKVCETCAESRFPCQRNYRAFIGGSTTPNPIGV